MENIADHSAHYNYLLIMGPCSLGHFIPLYYDLSSLQMTPFLIARLHWSATLPSLLFHCFKCCRNMVGAPTD
ncbi:hypothetical protein BD769DRAFT_174940 [Suillus cothurnatus]|nr:hypothetical protein BD769DRAFT_174940 [Suillus cothurnatus]